MNVGDHGRKVQVPGLRAVSTAASTIIKYRMLAIREAGVKPLVSPKDSRFPRKHVFRPVFCLPGSSLPQPPDTRTIYAWAKAAAHAHEEPYNENGPFGNPRLYAPALAPTYSSRVKGVSTRQHVMPPLFRSTPTQL